MLKRIVSVLGALWSAAGCIGVFMQASNAIDDVPEGRPIWKTLPIRLGVTLITGVLLTAAALMVLFAILYWASPNAKHGGFRWVSPRRAGFQEPSSPGC